MNKPTIDEVLDALNVFNKPAEEDMPWDITHYFAVAALPEFIHNIGRAWYSPKESLDMVLHCPRCGKQHIDKDEWTRDPHDMEQGLICTWKNVPHRSHLCGGCGHIWRPADVPTNGVAAVKTAGKNDSPLL